MSNRFESESERADGDRSSTNVMQLLGQMLMLPFTVFVYSMEMFVRTVKGIQRVADQGMDVMAGGPTQPRPGVPVSEGRPTDQTTPGGGAPPLGAQRQGGWGELKIQKITSTGDGTVEDTAEANQKEIAKMADKNLSDDQLKLVRYKILFVKRDYEYAFPEKEELVWENMTGDAFAAWKVAEFIQNLGKTELPSRWKERRYPLRSRGTGEPAPPAAGAKSDAERYEEQHTYKYEEGGKPKEGKWRIVWLPESDKKYLRVFYEVIDRYVREDLDYERRQLDALEDIAKAVREK
jgi:hypothetical protein